jgi:SAM-dependent methyltransferase
MQLMTTTPGKHEQDVWALNAAQRAAEIPDDPAYQELVRIVLAELDASIDPGSRVLDVGCGLGFLTHALAKAGYEVVGIDQSGTIEWAQRRVPQLADRFIQMDVEAFSREVVTEQEFQDALYDDRSPAGIPRFMAAVANMALHTDPQPMAFFEAVKRCLYPFGSFVITIPHPAFYLQSKTDFDEPFEYTTPAAYQRPLRIHDQSAHQHATPFHHHPVSHYMNLLLQTGFMVTHVYEPPRVGLGAPHDILVIQSTLLPDRDMTTVRGRRNERRLAKWLRSANLPLEPLGPNDA